MSAIVIEGLLVGLAVAAPFGPISLLCVQRALTAGLVPAIACAAGAAVAHGIFAMIGTAWFEVLGATLVELKTILNTLAGFLFIYFGAQIVWRGSSEISPVGNEKTTAHFTSTLFIALCNPLTVLPYFGIALSLGKNNSSNLTAIPFAIGALCGALLWYATLISIALFCRRASGALSGSINLAVGALFMSFGGLILINP